MTTALLLDVDDTLFDTRAAGEAAVAELWTNGRAGLSWAGVHFRSDPRGFFGRFSPGELTRRGGVCPMAGGDGKCA